MEKVNRSPTENAWKEPKPYEFIQWGKQRYWKQENGEKTDKTLTGQGTEGILGIQKKTEPLLDPAWFCIDFLLIKRLINGWIINTTIMSWLPVPPWIPTGWVPTMWQWVPTIKQREEESYREIIAFHSSVFIFPTKTYFIWTTFIHMNGFCPCERFFPYERLLSFRTKIPTQRFFLIPPWLILRGCAVCRRRSRGAGQRSRRLIAMVQQR